MKLGSQWLFMAAAVSAVISCSAGTLPRSANTSLESIPNPSSSQATNATSQNAARIVHVLVALCDNEHQGIVPVPARLGNGEDLQGNLYWGAAYGVKAFFAKSVDWKLVEQTHNPSPAVLERCIFKNKNTAVYLVADAYRGAEIKKALADFFDYAAGGGVTTIGATDASKHPSINAGGAADLVVFVGHNGLMDFNLPSEQQQPRGDHSLLRK